MRIEDEQTWPREVVEYLDQFGAILKPWALKRRARNDPAASAAEYDETIYRFRAVLRSHALHGYHCTRLTDEEVSEIIRNGMRPLSREGLGARIDAVRKAKLVDGDFAKCLLSENQAHCRAGQIWFCFFPPRRVCERGISHFFRYWGGESLYISHQNETGVIDPRLGAFGTPCLVEAEVPIARLNPHSSLEDVLVRNYLRRRGHRTRECCDHENYAIMPIPASCIARVIRFPSRDFVRITRCDQWEEPLVC